MKRSIVVMLGAAAVGVGFLLRQAGCFDRPPLEEVTLDGPFYLFLAASTSKDIGGNVMRLLEGTKAAVSKVASPEELAMPAQVYGSPKGAEALSVGLYIDNPMKDDEPRWGLGWAIQAESDEQARHLKEKVEGFNTLPEEIRLVKLEAGIKVLRGRIPWRSVITPAVGPYLHWGRYYEIYHKNDEYSSDNGRPDGHEGSLALEVYVTGPNDSMEYIDYIILMGDTSAIFDGMDPPEPATVKTTPAAPKVEVEINPVPVGSIQVPEGVAEA